jgi:radical SAM-linked protein
MSNRQAPVRDTAPVAARYRLRYRKAGRMRFTSARDFQRALERAVRRAGVPVALTAGFNPHPRIAYSNPVATGVASEAEYFELALTRTVDPEKLRSVLDDGLPDGFDVVEAVPALTQHFGDRLQASDWQFTLVGVAPIAAGRAANALELLSEFPLHRMTKSGGATVDVRDALLSSAVLANSDAVATGQACAILQVVVRHVTPSVRPLDVLTALSAAGLPPTQATTICRLAQGPLGEDGRSVGDPLEPDRIAASIP